MKHKITVTIMCLLVIMSTCSCNAGRETSSVSDDEIIETNDYLTSPPVMMVSTYGKEISVMPYSFDFTYAVNDSEWSSVNSYGDHPLDMHYNQYLNSFDKSKVNAVFSFATQPDKITSIKKYDASLLMPDYDEEEAGLLEKLQRNEQYEEFEEINVDGAVSFPRTIELDADGDYIYEVTAIWDREFYRGTGYYCFLVRKK